MDDRCFLSKFCFLNESVSLKEIEELEDIPEEFERKFKILEKEFDV